MASVIRFFNDNQKHAVAKELASKLMQAELPPSDVDLLAELIPVLNQASRDDLLPELQSYIDTVTVSVGDKTSAMSLMAAYPKLAEDSVNSMVSKLASVKRSDTDDSESIVYMLEFLAEIFSKLELSLVVDDNTFFNLLMHEDENVATASLLLLRWRADHICRLCSESAEQTSHYWDLIFRLHASVTSKKQLSRVLVMWLRLLNSSEARFLSSNTFQQRFLAKAVYWTLLQDGLAHPSHEIRKITLSILQLSLQAIACDVDVPNFHWSQSEKDLLLREWQRYVTLYELLGIDTSLHQTQAAVKDILAIMTPASKIHPSWGFCVLATGFQASMDSVRRFANEVLLSIEPANLHLLKYALPYLKDHFLPYMMLLRHFAVRQKDASTHELTCEYAERFNDFIAAVLRSLDDSELGPMALTILSTLAKSPDMFDAVKIYTLYGMTKGLGLRAVLQFGVHDQFLVQMFRNVGEGLVFNEALQVLNLKLIMNFEPSSLLRFSETLARFVSFNGHDLLLSHLLQLAAYANKYNVSDFIKCIDSSESEEQQVVLLILASQLEDTSKLDDVLLTRSHTVLAKLIASKFVYALEAFKNKMGDVSSSLRELAPVYEALSRSSSTFPSEKTEAFLEKLALEVKSSDYGDLLLAVSRARYINLSVKNSGKFPSLPWLLELQHNLFINSAECAKSISGFHKLKNEMTGEFYTMLAQSLRDFFIPDYMQWVIDIIDFNSVHPSTLLAICDCLQTLLDHQPSVEISRDLCSGLVSCFNELVSDRLRLTEKEVHISLIRTVLHPTLLKLATKDTDVANTLEKFCKVVIRESFGRRGLITTLVKCFADIQVESQEVFETIPFVPQLLIEIMTHQELMLSAYRIETLVADLYDRELCADSGSIYDRLYGVDEIAYKVWALGMANSIKSTAFATLIMDAIFDEADPYLFFKVAKNTDGAEENKRIQIAKLALSVLDLVEKSYFSYFMKFLENDPSPLVRLYFEWMLARHVAKGNDVEAVFSKLQQTLLDHEAKPIHTTIFERVLFLVAKAMDGEHEAEFLTRLIAIVVPAASTNKAVTRHFSMSLAISIHDEIRTKNVAIDDNLKLLVENMYNTAISTDAFGQHRSGDHCLWDVRDLNLVSISGGILLRLSDREVDFLAEEEFNRYLTTDTKNALRHPIGENQRDLWTKLFKGSKKALQEQSNVAASPLQTKSGAWNILSESGPSVVRSDLVVVASLVDKPPNLGGICRLCDVLGAGLMTIHDENVKKNPVFRNVAVTADYWMPMLEVKPHNIVDFLKAKKLEGYTLIGLEQTDKSVVLSPELKFPQKSLVVLGREKEGVPGEILAELDMCAEIKQVGVVRSMNIQTATAVLVHAYSSQHC